MSLEVIDIFIIVLALLFSLIFILRKVKRFFNKSESSHCAGCTGKSCSVEENDSCRNNEVFKKKDLKKT